MIYAPQVVYIDGASLVDRLHNGESLHNPLLDDIILVVWNQHDGNIYTTEIGLKSGLDLTFCWTSSLKKVMDKMLMMHIKFKCVLFVVITYYNSPQNWGNILLSSKAMIWFTKKLLLSSVNKWFSDMWFCLLFFNINKNINQCKYRNYNFLIIATIDWLKIQELDKNILWGNQLTI